ncbi:MAG: hypothetical protein K0R38_2055 [Polyangiaceae bacterium]|jgi:hypothetical protein|nr:hypothetical protein [Polyangiaceae bacterium]
MHPRDFCELSVEQEEYLVELLCTRGACTFDLFVRELDALCRQSARAHSTTSPSSIADCASSSSLSLK